LPVEVLGEPDDEDGAGEGLAADAVRVVAA
jgi:hypothetical protein